MPRTGRTSTAVMGGAVLAAFLGAVWLFMHPFSTPGPVAEPAMATATATYVPTATPIPTIQLTATPIPTVLPTAAPTETPASATATPTADPPLPATATVPAVPTAYAGLYATVATNVAALTDMANALPTAPPTTTTHLLYGTSLAALNGQDTRATPSIAAVNAELDRLAYLGIQGVTVAIPYPDFLPWYAQSASLLTFYQKVAAAVQAHGMQLFIERGDNAGTTYPANFCTYEAEQDTINRTILAQLHPAYLWLVNEPSTRLLNTGYAAFTAPVSTTNYAAFLAGDAADPDCPDNTPAPLVKGSTLIAAGQGSWESLDYARGYATITAVDVLDVHVFPVISSTAHPYEQRILDVATIAHQAGKGFALTEAWDDKQGESELGMSYPTLIGRDVFNFWEPLDQQFIDALAQIAEREGAVYVSPYWAGYFEAALPYRRSTADETTTASALRSQVTALQAANRAARGPFSPLGVAYCQRIAQATGVPCVALTPQPSATPTATATPRPTRTPLPTRTPRAMLH